MNIHVALLRGINVSGRKTIKMKDLKKVFESLRFKQVTTYIQSGNVVFGSPTANTKLLRNEIEKKLLKVFGFELAVIVKTIRELEDLVERNPFRKVELKENERLYVTFLAEGPSKGPIANLSQVKNDIDEIRLSGSEVYILCRKGYGRTLFSNTFIEKRLSVSATTRNWATVNRLISLAKTDR